MTKNSKKKLAYEKEFLALYSEVKTISVNGIVNKFRVSESEAEDIYQSAVIKAYKKLDLFKGESSLKTWLYRIVQNAAFDYMRKPSMRYEKNSFRLDEEETSHRKEFSDRSPNPAQLLEAKGNINDLKFKIEIIFSKLSSNHRRVLTLLYANEATYQKTAKTMRCSIGTVMSRAFYARKRFIKLFLILEAKMAGGGY